jgi:hypothetical protein
MPRHDVRRDQPDDQEDAQRHDDNVVQQAHDRDKSRIKSSGETAYPATQRASILTYHGTLG